ncbi:MAG: DinB family protein [Flavobacteriales bacterium]|nr:DinB family protein [Flavobacteriales bacterium]
MERPGGTLRSAIARAQPLLLTITDKQASLAPAQGKWSPKEIIGHLLDSANNNLARFIRLQSTDSLLFEPYAQEEWVHVQAYIETDWSGLVELWARYNLHIARVMDLVPDDARSRQRREHRPLGSTYAPLPADGIPTLDWLMRDYVEHLKHHLRQIDLALVR